MLVVNIEPFWGICRRPETVDARRISICSSLWSRGFCSIGTSAGRSTGVGCFKFGSESGCASDTGDWCCCSSETGDWCYSKGLVAAQVQEKAKLWRWTGNGCRSGVDVSQKQEVARHLRWVWKNSSRGSCEAYLKRGVVSRVVVAGYCQEPTFLLVSILKVIHVPQ